MGNLLKWNNLALSHLNPKMFWTKHFVSDSRSFRSSIMFAGTLDTKPFDVIMGLHCS